MQGILYCGISGRLFETRTSRTVNCCLSATDKEPAPGALGMKVALHTSQTLTKWTEICLFDPERHGPINFHETSAPAGLIEQSGAASAQGCCSHSHTSNVDTRFFLSHETRYFGQSMESVAEVLRAVGAIVSAFQAAADALEFVKERKEKKRRKKDRELEELLEIKILHKSLVEVGRVCLSFMAV